MRASISILSGDDLGPPPTESLTDEKESGESYSETIIQAVAEAADGDPIAPSPTGESTRCLPPLYSVIDPDALDTLLGRTTAGWGRAAEQVAFRYHGYDVTVSSDGVVRLTLSPCCDASARAHDGVELRSAVTVWRGTTIDDRAAETGPVSGPPPTAVPSMLGTIL
jgi:hypothetical protein